MGPVLALPTNCRKSRSQNRDGHDRPTHGPPPPGENSPWSAPAPGIGTTDSDVEGSCSSGASGSPRWTRPRCPGAGRDREAGEFRRPKAAGDTPDVATGEAGSHGVSDVGGRNGRLRALQATARLRVDESRAPRVPSSKKDFRRVPGDRLQARPAGLRWMEPRQTGPIRTRRRPGCPRRAPRPPVYAGRASDRGAGYGVRRLQASACWWVRRQLTPGRIAAKSTRWRYCSTTVNTCSISVSDRLWGFNPSSTSLVWVA